MHAIGYLVPGAINQPSSLVDIELPTPTPLERDILVEVKAVSVNPVDYKVRKHTPPADGEHKVLGWDASGIVRAVGAKASRFKPGDEVYYAGSIARPGSNMEFHLVDERIVGSKPKSLDWAQAAALPLTSLTAWEAMFDRLEVHRPIVGAAPTILIIGGAGGVGSIAIQLARQLTDLTVIGTASRPETEDWVKSLGAHHVIDHSKGLSGEMQTLGIGAPAFVFSTTHTENHYRDVAELIAPQGKFVLIDDPSSFDIMAFKRKAVSIHHELMFTRSLYGTPDIDAQGKILDQISRLVDAGTLRTTLAERLSPINATTLMKAHASVESGKMKGKIVIEGGFGN